MKGNGQFGGVRRRLGASLALLALGLFASELDLAPAAVRVADLSPAAVYRAADRQAHESYAYAARVASDLRLVYELHARFDELRAEAAKTPAPAAERTSGKNKPLRCSASVALSR